MARGDRLSMTPQLCHRSASYATHTPWTVPGIRERSAVAMPVCFDVHGWAGGGAAHDACHPTLTRG